MFISIDPLVPVFLVCYVLVGGFLLKGLSKILKRQSAEQNQKGTPPLHNFLAVLAATLLCFGFGALFCVGLCCTGIGVSELSKPGTYSAPLLLCGTWVQFGATTAVMGMFAALVTMAGVRVLEFFKLQSHKFLIPTIVLGTFPLLQLCQDTAKFVVTPKGGEEWVILSAQMVMFMPMLVAVILGAMVTSLVLFFLSKRLQGKLVVTPEATSVC